MKKLIFIFLFLVVHSASFAQTTHKLLPMQTQIFAKSLAQNLTTQVCLTKFADVTSWEVALDQSGNTSRQYFYVRNEELMAQAAKEGTADFMQDLIVYNAFIDTDAPALLLVVDRFGCVDVLKYALNSDFSFTPYGPEILPLRRYEPIPLDVPLSGEWIEDVVFLKGRMVSLSRSMYRFFDSYFVNIMNFDTKTSTGYRISTTDLERDLPIIHNDQIQQLTEYPFNSTELTKVLAGVVHQSVNARSKVRYKFSLVSSGFKEGITEKTTLQGAAFFFVDIDDMPMIMYYANLNEWRIAPESVLKHESELSAPDTSELNSLFKYQ